MNLLNGHARRGGLIAMWVFCVCFLTAALAVAQDAPKGPTPKVLLLPTQSVNNSISSIIPERIGEQVDSTVKSDPKVEVMPTYEEIRKQLGGQGVASAVIAEAEQLYTSGIGLLTAGEDQKAAESFQRSVDLMEANIADIGNYDILSDALANLALAYHNSKFEVDAKKRMKQYAHLRPTATLDAEKYPKEMQKIFTKETKKVSKGGPGKLTITSNVKGAKVYIDGVEKGATPVTVEDVGFGHHYLVVRGPTGSVWAEKIRVKGRGKAQKFDVKLGAAGAQKEVAGKKGALPAYYVDLNGTIKSGRFSSTGLQPYTSELAKETGAQYIAWVIMYKDGRKYSAVPFVYRAEDGLFVRGETSQFNIELSNLRKGVSALSAEIVDMVVNTSEDAAITDVELGPAPVVVAAASPSATPTETNAAASNSQSPYTDSTVTKKAEVPPSEETSTWTYVAAGGAVLLVGALIAGGIFLLSDDGNPDRANGFDTVVSW